MTKTILEVRGLGVHFTRYARGLRQEEYCAVSGLDITVGAGEILAVVGASGSGKSLLAHAILGILPDNARVSGEMIYKGEPLTDKRIEALRGSEISLAPQGVSYLDPLMKVGGTLSKGRKDNETLGKIKRALARFGLAENTLTLYPFQLSGGMARRVLISSAVIENPSLVIADEPTPGVNPQTARRIMGHFREMAENGAGVLFITHDLELAVETADRVAVFSGGRTVEVADAAAFEAGELQHEYTRALWRALPQNEFYAGAAKEEPREQVNKHEANESVREAGGHSPQSNFVGAAKEEPRELVHRHEANESAREAGGLSPQGNFVGAGKEEPRERVNRQKANETTRQASGHSPQGSFLGYAKEEPRDLENKQENNRISRQASGLSPLRAKGLTFGYGSGQRYILEDFSFSLAEGQRLGLLAPSGYGKTTLCRILAGYDKAERGEVVLGGRTISEFRGYCPVQLIWQHPEMAVDPRVRMREVLREGGADGRIVEALGIREEWLSRFPGELSGGELQRFCIARALGEGTKFILADEITAMLDLISQAQLWRFLLEETERRGIGLLAVSHSRPLLERICGEILEPAPREDV